jgi:hypothetical protein
MLATKLTQTLRKLKSETLEKFRNEMLEKDEGDQLERSCAELSVTVSQGGKEYRKYNK